MESQVIAAYHLQKAHKTPSSLDQKINSNLNIIIQTLSAQNKESILKATKEKGQIA